MKIYDNFSKLQKLIAPFGGFLLLSIAAPLKAESYSADDLTRLVAGWAIQQTQSQDQMSVQVFPLNSRLAAKDCPTPPELSWVNPALQQQNSVKIHCNSDTPWQVFVNVRLVQQVEVVVSSKQLSSGSIVSSSDLALEVRDVRQARGQYLTTFERIDGARLKRTVSHGQILKLSDFCLVCKGDQVTIEGISGTLAVSTTGKALSDATLGETVRVQNSQSGRVVEAQVTAVKKVTINL